MAVENGAAPHKKRRSFWRWLVWAVLMVWAAIIVALAGAGMLGLIVYDHVTSEGAAGRPVTVVVPQGASGGEIGDLLSKAGLIEHPAFFRVALRLDKSGKPLKHGVYELPSGLSATQLLARLQEGPSHHLNANQVAVTIPEGLTIQQIAAEVDDSEGFLEAARDRDRIAEMGIEAESLEGFLMPNTYFFDDPPTGAQLVERMTSQFEKEYERLREGIRFVDDYDKMTIVTVASLVEEEAKVDEERPIVAAVLYNRLDEDMHIEMDSTLQYALNKYGERLLDADKEVDSPYNTYRNKGLPPGPISNPGVASLRAALMPEDVDYLYFVSNADGQTHTFSNTYREHQEAVARYRREIQEQRREVQQREQEAEELGLGAGLEG